MGRWMFSALPFAGSAAILLFSIRGSTIADDIFASAVRALHGDRDHQTFYFFQDFCFYSITAFSFCPLPTLCGLPVFFVPAKAGIERGKHANVRVRFYLGFSYSGLRAWNVEQIQ